MESRNRILKIFKNFSESYVLSMIILFGAFLRIFQIGTQSIWLDEAFTYLDVQHHSIKSLVLALVNVEDMGPLYFVFLYIWTKIFGLSLVLLRIPSSFLGVFVIFLTYLLVKKIFSKRIGLISAFFVAMSPFHIWYSQEARPYSLWLVFLLLSTYFFLRLYQEKKPVFIIFYSIFSILSLYTHILSAFIFLVQNIFIILKWWREKKYLIYWFVNQTIIALCFSPWLILIKMNLSDTVTTQYLDGSLRVYGNFLPKAALSFLIETFYIFSIGFSFYTINIPSILILVIPLIFGTLFVLGMINLFKKKNDWLFMALHLIIPTLIVFLIILFAFRWMTPRYIMLSSLFYLPILAIGLNSIKMKHAKRAIFISLCLSWGFFINNYYFNPDYQREQWRDAAEFVTANINPDDIVLFNAPFVSLPFNFYFKANNQQYRISRAEIPSDLDKYVKNELRVWVIFSHTNKVVGQDDIESWLKNNDFEVELTENLKSIKVFCYKKI